jgi:hypothetical protein
VPLCERDPELPILDPVALVIAFKLHGEVIRGSQALSITLQGWAPIGIKTHTEYPDIFFWKYYSPYHIEMGNYVLIDLLWAGGSVAPAQPTSLHWNWGIFAQTCSTCLEGPYRKDSFGAHPCRAIDRAWEPRIPSPCSLKAITHAIGSITGISRSRWNRGTKYYPVGMKTHIEYPNILFLKI